MNVALLLSKVDYSPKEGMLIKIPKLMVTESGGFVQTTFI